MAVSLLELHIAEKASGRPWHTPGVVVIEDFRDTCRGWGFRLGRSSHEPRAFASNDPTIAWEIVHVVSKVSGVSLRMLLSGERRRKVTRPRQLAMLLIRELTTLSRRG